MARTAAKNKRISNHGTPQDRFDRLDYKDKLICYRYYQFTASQGVEGWNPAQVGSVNHLRSSFSYLLQQLTQSVFRHKAKSMVTLAEAFVASNTAVPEPTLPSNISLRSNTKELSIHTLAARAASTAQHREAVHLEEQEENTRNRMSQLNMRTPPRVARSPGAINNLVNKEPVLDAAEQSLPVPTCFGMFPEMDYTTRKVVHRVLIRQIVHSGVEIADIEFEWLTPRKCLLRLAWPIWFQQAELMSEFTRADDGTVAFPPEHVLTMDICSRNELLKDEDGRVWDEGILQFEQDMKEDALVFELLSVRMGPGNSPTSLVKVLQAFAE